MTLSFEGHTVDVDQMSHTDQADGYRVNVDGTFSGCLITYPGSYVVSRAFDTKGRTVAVNDSRHTLYMKQAIVAMLAK